ncbi:MAG: AraC family transcriptional regulator [Cellulosilyticaceae bacterium]
MSHLPSRKILYHDTLTIPGLELIGYNRTTKAHGPMDLHTHPDCMEIVFILKGSQTYYVGHEAYNISRGDVFVTYPNELHHTGPHPQGVSEFIWLQLRLSENQSFLGLQPEYSQPLLDRLHQMTTHLLLADKEMLALLQKSFEAFDSGVYAQKLYGLGLLMSLLFKLFYFPDLQASPNTIIQDLTRYIGDHITEPLPLDELCKAGHLSRSALQHQFKDYVGQSPRDYINCQKIEHAKLLFKRGVSVTEAAMHLSFSTSDYFATTFKKYTAQTPSEYINSLSKKP